MLVIATHGEWGEVPDDLAPGETLVHRREAETAESARILGIHRVVWLGYEDSGMTGWEQNCERRFVPPGARRRGSRAARRDPA